MKTRGDKYFRKMLHMENSTLVQQAIQEGFSRTKPKNYIYHLVPHTVRIYGASSIEVPDPAGETNARVQEPSRIS